MKKIKYTKKIRKEINKLHKNKILYKLSCFKILL